MTLFSLNRDRVNIKRDFFIYCGVVIFCMIFGVVYETYSHGIVSHYMLHGFAFPLCLGLLPYFILLVTKTENCPNIYSSYSYNAGVATVTVGSYFKGVLDIYGTTRDVYVTIYFSVGISLLILGLIAYIVSLICEKSSGQKDQD